MGEVAHVGAAIFFADGNAEYAQIAHLAPQVHRELVAAVDVERAWGDLGCRELLDRLAQGGDVFAMVKGQAWKMQHVVSTKCGVGGRGIAMIRPSDVNVNVK